MESLGCLSLKGAHPGQHPEERTDAIGRLVREKWAPGAAGSMEAVESIRTATSRDASANGIRISARRKQDPEWPCRAWAMDRKSCPTFCFLENYSVLYLPLQVWRKSVSLPR